MKYLKKRHLTLNFVRSNKVALIKQCKFAVYFMTSGLLKVAQFNANIFFIKRKLKILGKIFLRISFSSQFTKKPIGVRMGKGKGALSDFFIKVNQGQLFFEFYKSDFESLKTKNEIYEHLNMVVTKVSNKSHIKLRLMSVDF